MKNNTRKILESSFEKDVKKGLTDFPKHISSKYIYDKNGDELFQKIMAMPGYYLTDCEFNILDKHHQALAELFVDKEGFDLIELGAGDGKKTKILLRYLEQREVDFKYFPVDISAHILADLKSSLQQELPEVSVKTLQGTYFEVLQELAAYNERKKVILFLGSNIGNLRHEKAIAFLTQIRKSMRGEDMLFMGFDQKKNPHTILEAYNDKEGITEAFNKNLLRRINSELHADFDLDSFMHWETYNPETGTARSFLLSKIAQRVHLKKLDLTVRFEAWESLHIEISQKYTDAVVQWLAGEAGLEIKKSFTGDRGFYKNYIFQCR